MVPQVVTAWWQRWWQLRQFSFPGLHSGQRLQPVTVHKRLDPVDRKSFFNEGWKAHVVVVSFVNFQEVFYDFLASELAQ